MTTQYAEVLAALLERMDGFRRSDVSLDDLRLAIWEVTRVVSSPEERELRDALQHAEGRLDTIQYTVEEPGIRSEALKILDAIEARVRAAMSPP